MASNKPFIPRDKPKFWVVGILAGLIGLGSGLIAFLAGWFKLSFVEYPFIGIFIICWLTFGVCWFGALFGSLTGRYRNLQEKPWHEQVW